MLFDKEKMKARKEARAKKKKPPEKFISLTANGVPTKAINFFIKKTEDDVYLEVRGLDVLEELHYEHVDFELKTNLKLIKVSGTFREAKNDKNFKLYIFSVDSYEQFFN